jgi:hypothetical protein
VRWLAVDVAGNSSTGQARFAVDATAPVTTASLAPAAVEDWYRAPTVTLVASDDVPGGGAGVDKTEYRLDGGAWTAYTAPFAVTGDGNHLLEYRSLDLAGNLEEIQTLAFKIDATQPTISLARPAEDGSYALGSAVTAAYTCGDALSGVESCVGTVPAGGPLDTATVGTKSFTVTAVDVAGNRRTLTRTYEVVWAGYRGFFQPVDNGTLNVAQAGSAIPVKFTLGGDFGLSIMAAGYPQSVALACPASAPTDAIEETMSAGGSSLQFGDGQYVYVWKTQAAWAGTCRQLVVKLRDNTEHRASFRFK